ncbi:unnamed protein product [Ectocarpus sp. 13 AM-2016]
MIDYGMEHRSRHLFVGVLLSWRARVEKKHACNVASSMWMCNPKYQFSMTQRART